MFAIGLMVPAVPGLRRWLLGAGKAGWVFSALLIASAFFVWGVAWYLVERDTDLSATAWSRWTIALMFLNLGAGNVYVIGWWLRPRRPAA